MRASTRIRANSPRDRILHRNSLPRAAHFVHLFPSLCAGVSKTHLAEALGYEAINQGKEILYRSIFELVRDFMKDEAFNQQTKHCADT